MGHLDVRTTSVAQCMRLYSALGNQVGLWVQFGGRRLRLVQLKEMGDEEEVVVGQDAIEEVGGLQYVSNGKKIALHWKVSNCSLYR